MIWGTGAEEHQAASRAAYRSAGPAGLAQSEGPSVYAQKINARTSSNSGPTSLIASVLCRSNRLTLETATAVAFEAAFRRQLR